MATSKRRPGSSRSLDSERAKPAKKAYSVHPAESIIKALLLGGVLFFITLFLAGRIGTAIPFLAVMTAQVVGGIALCFIQDWRWFGVGLLSSFPVCIAAFSWVISKVFGLGWF